MMVLTFYVPTTDKEKVKNALFEAGAGKLGDYECCSFETEGMGQFRPLEWATPSIGKIGEIQKVPETRVEMCFTDTILKEVVEALKSSHPYETVAYNIFRSIDV